MKTLSHENKAGLQSSFRLTRLVHYLAANWHNLSPPLTWPYGGCRLNRRVANWHALGHGGMGSRFSIRHMGIRRQLTTYGMCLTFICTLLFGQEGYAQNDNFKRGTFIISKKWLQFTDDQKQGIFRSYAGLVTDKGLSDFPNLFVMNCASRNHYLILHFPQTYAFSGFSASDRMPKTEVLVITEKRTFKVFAELNKNEFFIDIGRQEIELFRDLWNSNSLKIDVKIGPNLEVVHLAVGDENIDKAAWGIVSEFGKKQNKAIAGVYLYDNVVTRCLSKNLESETGRYWIVWGSVTCNECKGTGDKTTYIKVSKRGGERDQEACFKAKAAAERAFTDQKLTVDLLCLKVDNPDEN